MLGLYKDYRVCIGYCLNKTRGPLKGPKEIVTSLPQGLQQIRVETPPRRSANDWELGDSLN